MNDEDAIAEMEDDPIDIDGINPEDERGPIMAEDLDFDTDNDADGYGSYYDLDTADDVATRSAHADATHDGDAEMSLVGQDEDVAMEDASSSSTDHHASDPLAKSARAGPPHRKLRIDWLLLLDLKFWKRPRASLREVYIGTLVLSPKYKKFMGNSQVLRPDYRRYS